MNTVLVFLSIDLLEMNMVLVLLSTDLLRRYDSAAVQIAANS